MFLSPVWLFDITSNHQRGTHHRPESKVGFVLRIGTATDGTDKIIVTATVHTNHQHVHVIVAEGTGERFFFQFGTGRFLNRFPSYPGYPVWSGTYGHRIRESSYVRYPHPSCRQKIKLGVHNFEEPNSSVYKEALGHMSWLKAEIVFEIIDTKIRKLLCIFKFMLKASDIRHRCGCGTGIAYQTSSPLSWM